MEARGIAPRMATIDEELGTLERDIRQLKIEYDQYFGGGRKRPPTEIEWRIDQLVKRYAERGGELKFHQRFRFNNLSQTYAKYKDIFLKRVALKEEGKIQRHFGAAAIHTCRQTFQKNPPLKLSTSLSRARRDAERIALSEYARRAYTVVLFSLWRNPWRCSARSSACLTKPELWNLRSGWPRGRSRFSRQAGRPSCFEKRVSRCATVSTSPAGPESFADA